MTVPTPITLLGVPGSPYTRKMLAVLRYRRIPHKLIVGSHRRDLGLPKPKVALLPTFYLPNETGDLEAIVDSTPLIRRFEAEFADRKIVPTDPAMAFLDYLLEDYADEWLTKAMFHYRWSYRPDIAKAAEILPRWFARPESEERLAPLKKMIAERQISRLYVVGSNETTAPVIEASYRRWLDLLKAHLDQQPFLFGSRPGAADFAVYGQLTQLAGFDPTPAAIVLERAPSVYAWVSVVDDLSGLEPTESDWITFADIPDTIKAMLQEIGRVYVPVLLANAAALASGTEKVETEVDGRRWVQEPFPYQGRCLQWLRDEYAKLGVQPRKTVDAALAGTGCEAIFV